MANNSTATVEFSVERDGKPLVDNWTMNEFEARIFTRAWQHHCGTLSGWRCFLLWLATRGR